MSTIQTWSRVMLALIMMSGGAFGQTASDPSEGLRAELTGTTGVTAIKWWGKTGRTYFLQSSETLLPGSWIYMPVVEVGSGSVRSWNLQTNAERMFVRLVYTDQANGGNASTADFDGDGISNAAEVAVGGPGTDPLLADSDWDGYNDGVELAAGTSPTNGQTNPGTTPPATGPLNPDGSYRNGLRLEMAAKYMTGEDYNSTFTTNPTFDCWANSKHTAGSSQSIFASQSSTTALLLPDCEDAFNEAGFLAPTKYLFQPNELSILRGNSSDYTVTGTGPQEGKNSKRSYRDRWEMQVQALASPAAPSWARRSLALLLLKDWSTTDVEAAGWLMLSSQNAKASTEVSRHCKPEGAKVVITPWLDPDVPDLAPSSTVDYRYINRALYLFDTDIEPAEGMIGVVGDLVRSKKDDSHVKHFVTPKMSTELPQEHVELKCGVNTTDFDKYFEWEGDGLQGSPSNTYKVSRATPDRKKVKIKNKQTGTVVAEMYVWVVWANVKQEQGASEFITVPNPNGASVWRVIAQDGNRKRFVFTIQPKSITDLNEDIPDLTGTASSQHLPPGSSKHRIDDMQYDPENPPQAPSMDSGDTADNKWDVSRQIRMTMTNTDLIPKAALKQLWWPSVCVGQPVATAYIPVPFPTLDFEGNDDPGGTIDEHDDPYHAFSSLADLRHEVGELTSIDAPSYAALDVWVTKVGMKFGVKAEFREFARVQLWDGKRTGGQFWFRISSFPDGEWLHDAKFDSGINFWKNDGSVP